MGRKGRNSMGKQKIEIKKIESEEARQVCFSKRKAGIFSKANEIVTLCGAKVAIVIESPAGCPFSFGSPSVNHVADRFLRGGMDDTETEEYEVQQPLKVQDLNNKIMEASSKVEAALRRKELLLSRIAEFCEANDDVRRVENVEDLNLDELSKMVELLEKIKQTVRTKIINDIIAKSGHPIHANLHLCGSGTGQGSAMPFATNVRLNNEGPRRVKASSSAMAMFPELGPRVNEDDSNKGKALDINLNLFEGGRLGHLGHWNPIISPNVTYVGPSESWHVPPEKTVSSRGLVELDLLGGRANFAAEKEPK